MTNTFHDFALTAGSGDIETVNTAAMLMLADKISGRPSRDLEDYRLASREVIRRYGYGVAAATLIAAGWLPTVNDDSTDGQRSVPGVNVTRRATQPTSGSKAAPSRSPAPAPSHA